MPRQPDNPNLKAARPVPLAPLAEVKTVPLQPTAPLTPLSASPLAQSPAASPLAPVDIAGSVEIELPTPTAVAPDLTTYAPPTPITYAPPPAPITYAPPPTPPTHIQTYQWTPQPASPRRRRSGFAGLRLLIPLIAITVAIVVSVATKSATSHIDITTPNFGNIPAPQVSLHTFKPPSTQQIQNDTETTVSLVTIGASEQFYEATHNRFTSSIRTLHNQGFRIPQIAHVSAGADGARGFCLVGSGGDGHWYLYDSRTSYLASKTFSSEPQAKSACPFRVSWGPTFKVV